ncbi:MAG: T9SS type A sorting domain-containing protein, partial [Flavobacteriaceae bacterium]|nr:T9SS type A sorting domain-containing protein [Flavobacteriaceae bacterium]
EVEVSIFDLLGKEVMNKTYNNTNKIKLDTQQFTTGVYIVKVQANTNKASLKLVVK